MKDIDRMICGDVFTSDEVKKNLDEMCLKFNGRFSGSEDARLAADYIADRLQRYGARNVKQPEFPMMLWERGSAEVTLAGVSGRTFSCLALPYCPSSDAEFDLVDLGMGHPADIEAAGDRIKGAAVIVDDINPPGGPRLHRLQKYIDVLEKGAGAYLFVQSSPGALPPTGSLAFNHGRGADQVIPAVGLSNEAAAELRGRMGEGSRVRLHLQNTLFKGSDRNVMGDIGPDNGVPSVIICGHYDGHDIAQGAVDNGSGTVVIMEIARVLAKLQGKLKRSIRFLLCGSEEMGLVGSYAYAREHVPDMDALRFVYNLDCVGSSGHLVLMMQNCPELVPVFNGMIRDMAAQIKVKDHLVPFSDHFPFLMHGVPAAMGATPGTGGRGWGHTFADTFEKVPLETLQRVSAQVARLAVRTVNADTWPGVRKDAEVVKRSLESTLMERLMRYEGHWPF